jgi:hypothetical protein
LMPFRLYAQWLPLARMTDWLPFSQMVLTSWPK